MKEYLTWWELAVATRGGLSKFTKWCGDYTTPFKMWIRKYVAIKQYKTVLDCGAGLCSEYYGFLHDGYPIEYHAIDITPTFVKRGKEQGINIILSEVEDMPFEDNAFEVCMCLDVLNHQLDFKKSIEEMLRVASKEVIISFQKTFLENTKVKKKRFDKDGKCILLHTFFSKSCLVNFLKEKKVKFKFMEIDRTLLFITKG